MIKFTLIIGGYFLSAMTAVIAQMEPALKELSAWIQYGALGLLGITVAGQLYIIVIFLQKQFDRMDAWEKQRHEDSAKLGEELSRLRENCAFQINK